MLFLVLAEGALNHPNYGNQQNLEDLGKKCISNKCNSYIASRLIISPLPRKILNNTGNCYEEKCVQLLESVKGLVLTSCLSILQMLPQ